MAARMHQRIFFFNSVNFSFILRFCHPFRSLCIGFVRDKTLLSVTNTDKNENTNGQNKFDKSSMRLRVFNKIHIWKVTMILTLITFCIWMWNFNRTRDVNKMIIKTCLSNEHNLQIYDIEKYIKSLRNDSNDACRKVIQILDQIFDIDPSSRSLKYSNVGFVERVEQWFDNNETLIEELKNQKIVTIYNKWSRVTSSYNTLRNKRPKYHQKVEEILEIVERSAKRCDFCQRFLAEDSLNLSNNKKIIIADNAFKIQDHNALFIFKKHNPLTLEIEDFEALFEIVEDWFQAVIKDSGKDHTHPALAWDSLPASGASQIHAHFHGFLGKNHKLGQFRGLQDAEKAYQTKFPGSNLIENYIDIHIGLGLSLKIGSVMILTPLDSIKDHEFTILGKSVDQDFVKALFLIYQTFLFELKIYSWSSAMSWPSPGLFKDYAMLRIGNL